MAIDFNGVNNNALNPQKQSVRERSDSTATNAENRRESPSEAEKSQSASVTLSRDAQSIQSAEDALRDQPSVDDNKVEQIRQALNDGSFQVDPDQLAQKMLEIDDGIFG